MPPSVTVGCRPAGAAVPTPPGSGPVPAGPGPGRSVPGGPGRPRSGPLLNGKGLVGQLKVQAPAELVGPSGEEGVQIVPVVFVGVDLLGVFPGPALHFLLKGEGPQGAGQSRRRLSRRRDHSGLPPGWPSGRRRWAGPFASFRTCSQHSFLSVLRRWRGSHCWGRGPSARETGRRSRRLAPAR